MAPKRKFGIDDAFNASLGRKEAFSAKAVKHFWTFLQEAELISDRRVVKPEPFFWLHPLYDLDRDKLLGVRMKNGTWLVRPQFPNGILFRKASQMGASVWSIALILWLCIDLERPLGIACYWPTEKDLQDFIQTRLDPMIEASPRLKSYMEDTKVDSTRAKQIGRSTVYFRYVAGKASADSIPVDILLCDEVRLWDKPGDTIQRLKERLRQSDVGLVAYFSTVGSQGDFMEQEWAASNQIKYFSHCASGCHTEISRDPALPNRLFRGDDLDSADPARKLINGVVLSDFLPDQIVRTWKVPDPEDEDGERMLVEGCYVCPCCGADLHDPSVGGYVTTRPDAEGMYALEFAATLAPMVGAVRMLTEYKKATDMKQFMNGYLAKPWLDPEGRIVKPEDWTAALDPELSWAERDLGGVNFLGADFRAREMHYTISEEPSGEVDEDGQLVPGRLLRIGVFQGGGWKPFLEGLLERFRVRRALIDYQPFTDETLELADRYEGRVVLAQYKPGAMIRTASQDGGKGARKVSPDKRERHMVFMDQYKSMVYSLNRFAAGTYRVPDAPLYQEAYKTRKKDLLDHFDVVNGSEGAGREGYKQHLMCQAVLTTNPTVTNQSREKVHRSGQTMQELIDADGFDPHWAHTLNYTVMAAHLGGADAGLVGTRSRDLQQQTKGGTYPAGYERQRIPGVPEGGRITGVFGNEDADPFAVPTPPSYRRSRQKVARCRDCVFGPVEGEALCRPTSYLVRPEEPACGLRGVMQLKSASQLQQAYGALSHTS